MKDMTPKEKAKELVNKFIAHAYHNNNELQCKDHAKQCALIAINETWDVLWNLYYSPNTSDSSDIIIRKQIDYYTEVKQEIELL